ncbi:MAG: hypothetical protein HC902_06390 [Calothrix sp. SM1_5_4]|nr:hypothetical protein [Calothrix sp. SM1_5_4]
MTVTAMGHGSKRWTKGALKPGQILILSKPLGTGLALQGLAAGALSPSGWSELKDILLRHHAPILSGLTMPIEAATDVSGFGLLGHLREMLGEKPLAVELEAAEIPLMREFESLYKLGLRTSLGGQNARAFGGGVVRGKLEEARLAALWDPQTNGPLLFAVDPNQAGSLLALLQEKGFASATIIGHVAPADRPEIRLITDSVAIESSLPGPTSTHTDAPAEAGL